LVFFTIFNEKLKSIQHEYLRLKLYKFSNLENILSKLIDDGLLNQREANGKKFLTFNESIMRDKGKKFILNRKIQQIKEKKNQSKKQN
jgi:hypothetical protein